jgi:hypothetical protein
MNSCAAGPSIATGSAGCCWCCPALASCLRISGLRFRELWAPRSGCRVSCAAPRVAAFRRALQVLGKEETPQVWAGTQIDYFHHSTLFLLQA